APPAPVFGFVLPPAFFRPHPHFPMTLLQELESRLAAAFEATLGERVDAPVAPATDLRFGDYQSNAAMALAKQRRTNPRALAEQVVAVLDLQGLGSADIAGPGFINFRIA